MRLNVTCFFHHFFIFSKERHGTGFLCNSRGAVHHLWTLQSTAHMLQNLIFFNKFFFFAPSSTENNFHRSSIFYLNFTFDKLATFLSEIIFSNIVQQQQQKNTLFIYNFQFWFIKWARPTAPSEFSSDSVWLKRQQTNVWLQMLTAVKYVYSFVRNDARETQSHAHIRF